MTPEIEALRKAIANDPNDWGSRRALVGALREAGATGEALRIVEEAPDLPGDEASLLLAAQCHHEAGSPWSEHVLDMLLERFPENEDARVLKGFGGAPEPPSVVPVEVKPVAPRVAPLTPRPEHATTSHVTPPVAVAPPLAVVPPVPSLAPARPEGEEAVDLTIPDQDAMITVGLAEELAHIQAMELASEMRHRAGVRRDKLNALVITVLAHVGIVVLLSIAVVSVPRDVPPQIVATASPVMPEQDLETQKITKPVPRPPSASANSLPDILSVSAMSDVSLSNMEVNPAQMPADMGVQFAPSMDFAMESSESMMLFGQKMEGEVLGVILDVSGSMAEYLPDVIREVDRNFKNAPIVYVTNALIRPGREETEIRPILEPEVKPFYDTEPGMPRRQSPYWFLWYDLPRKAPQRYVDRLINTFQTRPNSFIAIGGSNRIGAAVDFLKGQKIDSLYIFSDFEDYVDKDMIESMGQILGRSKIPTFVQPARIQTESLRLMTNEVANRSMGRQLPPLASLSKEDTGPAPLIAEKAKMPGEDLVKYATPRDEMDGTAFYAYRPEKGQTELARLEEPEFEVVFYGPEARGEIFLKNNAGQFIQYPITFAYHSWKYIDDGRSQNYRRRKFLRAAEEPTFDGKEIVWKMVLEDELRFDVHLYLDRKGMNATYVADPPADGTNDNAFIYFRLPPLAQEREDRYYGYDLPDEGLTLDQIREVAVYNTAIFNLPQAERDRFGNGWAQLKFEPGYNEIDYSKMVRALPSGVRDVEVKGPSFAERIFHARTTSSKVFLQGGQWRADFELWEGFHCRLVRPQDTRTRFTKTEAIAISIE